MLPDLQRLIALQRVDDAIESARRAIADHPRRASELETRLTDAENALAAAKARLQDCQTTRRTEEKELAIAQSHLSKYRDQLMAVKTNKEYHAVQKEIATAEAEVQAHEDKVLERLVEADGLAAAVKEGEQRIAEDRRSSAEERSDLDVEQTRLEGEIARLSAEREGITAQLSPFAASIFEQLSRTKKGAAMAEARAERCTVCQVRIRPQVFNIIRLNDSIIQCESCSRILYFIPQAAAKVDAASPNDAPA